MENWPVCQRKHPLFSSRDPSSTEWSYRRKGITHFFLPLAEPPGDLSFQQTPNTEKNQTVGITKTQWKDPFKNIVSQAGWSNWQEEFLRPCEKMLSRKPSEEKPVKVLGWDPQAEK